MTETVARGTLFVISGPSGAGKGTVRKELFKKVDNLFFSISCTTRKIRKRETDGVDYRFISVDEFLSHIDQDNFLEWARVHENYYGTLKSDVDLYLEKGSDVLLEIDVQGALQVISRCPEAVSVFLLPPSREELERRLRGRGSEDNDTINLRLNNSIKEMEMADKYDYVVVNKNVGSAVSDLENIIKIHRKKRQE